MKKPTPKKDQGWKNVDYGIFNAELFLSFEGTLEFFLLWSI